MNPNIPQTTQKRIVIVGAGFGGLKLARKLSNSAYQVVLLDKNNFHQFQPLFYQVATAGLEPSSISFPLRKIFQGVENIHIRVAEVESIDTDKNLIHSSLGEIPYDELVISIGCDTNYFGMESIQKNAIPMKSVSEALALRNKILQNFEDALLIENPTELQTMMNFVIVGGGATGVEISGTLAEMKIHVLPKDYPELDFGKMNIYLLEASPRTLNVMSEVSARKSRDYLEKMGVIVKTDTQVKEYNGKNVVLGDGSIIEANNLIWAAGVTGNKLAGFKPESVTKSNRLKVDQFNKVEGYENIYALGDIASMADEKYPNGHPQVAQPAIQQGVNLGKNFLNKLNNKPLKPFIYKDLGSMATIGRNLAVAELPFFKFQGFFAWLLWLFVHLMSIVGVKNRLFIFINWVSSYFTHDQSLRLILKAKTKA
ncbi:MAG: NAD(P)/FAD-dependent oxidoreductase [Cytophagales bacterium]